jgi:hypothetical protein
MNIWSRESCTANTLYVSTGSVLIKLFLHVCVCSAIYVFSVVWHWQLVQHQQETYGSNGGEYRTISKWIYLIGNPWPKDPKVDPSTDGRITSNRTFAKWRSEIGQLASTIERSGSRRSLRRPKLQQLKKVQRLEEEEEEEEEEVNE